MVSVTQGGLINDSGKLRLEVNQDMINEAPAILAIPKEEIFDEKTDFSPFKIATDE